MGILPTYEAVVARVAMFHDGADALALQAHFCREADQGDYDLDLIQRVRKATAAHVRQALDHGDIKLGPRLRLFAPSPTSEP